MSSVFRAGPSNQYRSLRPRESKFDCYLGKIRCNKCHFVNIVAHLLRHQMGYLTSKLLTLSTKAIKALF